MLQSRTRLPPDRRQQQGGWLLLISLSMFFVGSMVLYGFYAYWRRDDPLSAEPLPLSFLLSTGCLIAISGLLHLATRMVRKEKRLETTVLILISTWLAIAFTAAQVYSIYLLLSSPAIQSGNGKGLAGMVTVLALLHAIHVAGGIIALGIVAVRSMRGDYDHERHWPIDFSAEYWHFLDVVWLGMLAAFWLTTGGFH